MNAGAKTLVISLPSSRLRASGASPKAAANPGCPNRRLVMPFGGWRQDSAFRCGHVRHAASPPRRRVNACFILWAHPPFSGYHLYYPSRRQVTPALALLVEALRYRGRMQHLGWLPAAAPGLPKHQAGPSTTWRVNQCTRVADDDAHAALPALHRVHRYLSTIHTVCENRVTRQAPLENLSVGLKIIRTEVALCRSTRQCVRDGL